MGKWEDESAQISMVAKPVKREGHGKISLKNLHKYNVGFPSPCKTHIANAQQVSIPQSAPDTYHPYSALGRKNKPPVGCIVFSSS